MPKTSPLRLASAVALAVVPGFVAVPGAAQMTYENANGGSVELYGWLNPALQSFKDGVSTKSELVDNSNSGSRVGLWVRGPEGPNRFSFNFETSLGTRSSSGVSQTVTPPGINWQRTNIRKIDFSLKTENAGTFSAGQGSMASDGMVGSDFSGASLVTQVTIGDTAGRYQFRTTAGALSGTTMGAAFGDFDGGRLGRIRYDSPSFSGFKVSAAYGQQILASGSNLEATDIALRYSGQAAGVKMKGAIGYSRTDPGAAPTFNDVVGSFGVLFETGFNVTLVAGSRQNGGTYGYGKLGYRKDWLTVGETALAIDYYRGNDQTSAGSRSTSIGIGVVQKFDSANIEGYLGYRNYALTETAASYRDASSVLFGARWKF